MWDNVRSDVQNAKNDVELRRATALRRHAEEMKALDAERDEIETFERVAEAFVQKFNAKRTAPTEAGVGSSDTAQTSTSEAKPAEVQPGNSLQGLSANFGSLTRRFGG